MHVYTNKYTYIHTCIYIERSHLRGERAGDTEPEHQDDVDIYIYTYIHIYIHINMYI